MPPNLSKTLALKFLPLFPRGLFVKSRFARIIKVGQRIELPISPLDLDIMVHKDGPLDPRSIPTGVGVHAVRFDLFGISEQSRGDSAE